MTQPGARTIARSIPSGSARQRNYIRRGRTGQIMGRMSPEFPSATQLPSKTQLQVLRLRIACRTRQTFPHHRRSRMRTRAHLCRSALKVLRRGTHIPPQRHIRSRTRSPERRIGVIQKLPSEWLVSLWAWTMGSGALAAHTRATPHIRVPVFGIGPGDHQRPVRGHIALATLGSLLRSISLAKAGAID